MRTELEPAGDIRSVDLLAAFVGLWRRRASGSLSFSRAGSVAGFEISEGEIVGASSSEPHFETSAILVRAGKLDPGAIARVVVPEGNDPALAALQAGLLTRKDWNWGQKIRAIEILSDLLGWIEGRYEFDSDARPLSEEFSLTIPRLLLELFLRSRDRALVEHCLGPSDVPLHRAENFEGEFEELGLTAEARTVVALIDGKASAEEIAEKAPAEEFAVLKLLAALTTLGLVHSADAAPESSAGVGKKDSREKEPEEAAAAEVPEDVEPAVVEPQPPAVSAEPKMDRPLELFDSDFPAASRRPPPQETPEVPTMPPERFPVAEPAARSRTGLWAGALLLVLAAAVAGFLVLRSRGGAGGPEGGGQESLHFPPAETAVALPPTRPPAISPRTTISPRTALAPTGPERPAGLPPPRPSRSVGTPVTVVTPAPAIADRDASTQDWTRRAERDRSRLLSRGSTRYAVQLLLACELPTLADAFRHDQGGRMWILPISYQGRACFRVLWGAYASRSDAIRGKASIPGFFVTRNNHPAVVAVR